MISKKLSAISTTIGILGISTSALAITISPFDSAENLANAIVGIGITISNVSYTGAEVAMDTLMAELLQA